MLRQLPRAGKMGERRGLRVAVLGLVLGAAACYCLWRRAAGRGRRRGAPRVPPSVTEESPPSPHSVDADALQKLIHLLKATDDPLIQEQALITLSNSAAFSVNQDIIRNLDGLSVIGGMLLDCVPTVKEKALNALNNLSMNIKNQEEIQVYITQVCKNIESAPLNSDLQLAGLRLLTNMSVTNDYHYKMTDKIPCFLRLLSEGSERTQVQVLKVLVNLSANPATTRHFLKAQTSDERTQRSCCKDQSMIQKFKLQRTDKVIEMLDYRPTFLAASISLCPMFWILVLFFYLTLC
ncbi:armadillo repeat-containing protein 10 isoform X2 [Numida meleagris]|uniref:armadillo repeat-containing protein 10 isoform X2 n=1 Tax=Numida meleagris TaxID=8996 RepID=UPI000B3E3002|nr:armadillo repeat-containing protein 10 isoform X2 [Numida meleagris]